MKAKLLRNLGLKIVIDPDGKPTWVLPLIELQTSAAEAMTLEQLQSILDGPLAEKATGKIRAKVDRRLNPVLDEPGLMPDLK